MMVDTSGKNSTSSDIQDAEYKESKPSSSAPAGTAMTTGSVDPKSHRNSVKYYYSPKKPLY